MKKTRFYPTVWQAMVFPSGVVGQWDNVGQRMKELILKSDAATELGISEMEVNLTKISAIDDQGAEHDILNFPSQYSLPIKGMASGHFLKSKNLMKLPLGNYTTLRFYLGDDVSRFIYNDGETEVSKIFRYLDFKIESGLTIDGNQGNEVKMWFDFAPYKFNRHFKGFINLFNKQRNMRPRLAGSF